MAKVRSTIRTQYVNHKVARAFLPALAALSVSLGCDDRLEAIPVDVGFVTANDAAIEVDTDSSVTTTCDIFVQDCVVGACVPSPAGTPQCVSEGVLEAGSRCGDDSALCRAGLLCSQHESSTLTCREICDLRADTTCPSEAPCQSVAIEGLQNLGLCTP